VTTAIKSSLVKLHGAIGTLEDSVTSAMARRKDIKKEPDLFSLPLSTNTNAANDIDPKVLAGRLDSAIAKVEKILREG